MKYVLVVPDGAADDPLPELNGRTPLEAARTPFLDDLARRGTVGLVDVTPNGMYPGSDAANMSLLGYDPVEHYTGRGPVEAASLRIPMGGRDVAFRRSLVATDGEKMLDYSAGHIATVEAAPLIDLASRKLCGRALQLSPGISYRHILLWIMGPSRWCATAAREHGQTPDGILPSGDGETMLRRLIWDFTSFWTASPSTAAAATRASRPRTPLAVGAGPCAPHAVVPGAAWADRRDGGRGGRDEGPAPPDGPGGAGRAGRHRLLDTNYEGKGRLPSKRWTVTASCASTSKRRTRQGMPPTSTRRSRRSRPSTPRS